MKDVIVRYLKTLLFGILSPERREGRRITFLRFFVVPVALLRKAKQRGLLAMTAVFATFLLLYNQAQAWDLGVLNRNESFLPKVEKKEAARNPVADATKGGGTDYLSSIFSYDKLKKTAGGVENFLIDKAKERGTSAFILRNYAQEALNSTIGSMRMMVNSLENVFSGNQKGIDILHGVLEQSGRQSMFKGEPTPETFDNQGKRVEDKSNKSAFAALKFNPSNSNWGKTTGVRNKSDVDYASRILSIRESMTKAIFSSFKKAVFVPSANVLGAKLALSARQIFMNSSKEYSWSIDRTLWAHGLRGGLSSSSVDVKGKKKKATGTGGPVGSFTGAPLSNDGRGRWR